MSVQSLIADCDALLKQGKIAGVAAKLQTLSPASVEREDRLALANVCRRAGLFSLGLKLLTPIMHPDRMNPMLPPSAPETAEYAVLLMKIGSVSEALSLLQPLGTQQSLLYTGYCHMNQWEYSQAADFLLRYLQNPESPYQGMLAKVNLCAALVHSGRAGEAQDRIEAALSEASAQHYSRLQANLYELRAQISLEAGLETPGHADLERAFAILGGGATNDQLYLMKWLAVIESRKLGSIKPLLEFQKLARERHDWESAREADLQILKLEYDQERHAYLLFGSPWEEFRKRVADRLPALARSEYLWGGGADCDLDISLETECPPKIQALLSTLLSDFYAPLRLGAIFSAIFPDEKYHVLHSPNRVHQLLWRTRTWLKEKNLPLSISEESGRFALVAESPVGVRKTLESGYGISPLSAISSRFKGEFTSKEVQDALNASEPKVRRLIQIGLRDGAIDKIRRGRNISYRMRAG